MELSKEQLSRYSRHITLKEMGQSGQIKLLSSKVLVIGAGGLGSPVLLYLAAAGIGTIGIMDDDAVDYSNLQRQVIHKTSSVGVLKTESARKVINDMNPDVNVITYNEFASADNLQTIIKDYDIVLDCTDNFEAKFLISDACVLGRKPLVHAAVIRFSGQIMTYVPGHGPCYRCVFSDTPEDGAVKNSKQIGVFGPVPGMLGTLQAIECVKYLIGAGDLLTGYLLTVDCLTMQIKKMKLPPVAEDCPVCSKVF